MFCLVFLSILNGGRRNDGQAGPQGTRRTFLVQWRWTDMSIFIPSFLQKRGLLCALVLLVVLLAGRPGHVSAAEEIDHVQEMQIGGADIRENLWPLDASKNGYSGRMIRYMQNITVPRPTKAQAKAIAKNRGVVVFKFRSTEKGA